MGIKENEENCETSDTMGKHNDLFLQFIKNGPIDFQNDVDEIKSSDDIDSVSSHNTSKIYIISIIMGFLISIF